MQLTEVAFWYEHRFVSYFLSCNQEINTVLFPFYLLTIRLFG